MSLSHWTRPVEAPPEPGRDQVVMMMEDVSYTVGPDSNAVLRFFGCTAGGTSVTAFVNGFDPYFYVRIEHLPAPASLPSLRYLAACACYDGVGRGVNPAFVDQIQELPEFFDMVETLARPLCDRVRERLNEEGHRKRDHKEQEVKRQRGPSHMVKRVDLDIRHTSFYGYRQAAMPFYRITTYQPSDVPAIRGLITGGLLSDARWGCATSVYEANIPFGIRAMIDLGVVGCGWMEFPPRSYRVVVGDQRRSRTGLEIVVPDWQTIVTHKPTEPGWENVAPIWVLSFDIECKGRRGKFPTPENDPVIQIANYIHRHGDPPDSFRHVNVFNLHGCDPIDGAEVYTFDDERTLLCAWANFVRRADPCVVTGYNTTRFDIPYLLKRAKRLGITEKFAELGRLVGTLARLRTWSFSSKAYGSSKLMRAPFHGRVQTDAYEIVLKEEKYRKYTLNAVSAIILGDQKEDVHHSKIAELHEGTNADRRRLAVYCLKDALLPLRILAKKTYTMRYIEMSRVTGVPWETLLTRGQQIKVLLQLLMNNKVAGNGFLIPTINRKEKSYKGAIVLKPRKGFYKQPIATIDFSSLYPSIMQAYNLCYTTLLTSKQAAGMDPKDYLRTPVGFYFVRAHIRKGVLPSVLESLLSARSKAKKAKAQAEDAATKIDAALEKLHAEASTTWDQAMTCDTSEREALVAKSLKLWAKYVALDGRQLALKVSANSVYGFSAAQKLPCREIAASVTAYGRLMIALTTAVVQACRLYIGGMACDGAYRTLWDRIQKGQVDPRCVPHDDLSRAACYGPIVVPPSTWRHGERNLAGTDLQATVDVLLKEQHQDFEVIYGDTVSCAGEPFFRANFFATG